MDDGLCAIGYALRTTMRMVCAWSIVLSLGGTVGCKEPLTLAQQEQMVRGNSLLLDQVTTQAVVNVWGEPPHFRSKFTQFFVMPDNSMMPSFRVTSGETPRGWDARIHAGEGIFFLYPDRGWLLVFLDDRLVYKEELKDDDMRALVKTWAYEDRFKTRLDGAPVP